MSNGDNSNGSNEENNGTDSKEEDSTMTMSNKKNYYKVVHKNQRLGGNWKNKQQIDKKKDSGSE